MKNQNNLIAVTILSILSTVFTFFAPLAKQSTNGLLGDYSNTVSLFTGVRSDACVVLTVVVGLCLVVFACISLFSRLEGRGLLGVKIFGIALLFMQILCTAQSMNYYDDQSLLGAIRSEVSNMSVHPLAILTMIITLVAVVMCFTVKKSYWRKSNDVVVYSVDQFKTLEGSSSTIAQTEKIYYDGDAAGVYCKLSSTMWCFGDVIIPVYSVSSIILKDKKTPSWMKRKLIIALSLLVLSFLGGLLWAVLVVYNNSNNFVNSDKFLITDIVVSTVFLIIEIIAIVMLIKCLVAKIKSSTNLVITHSGVDTSVVKTRKKDLRMSVCDLHQAAVLCLQENAQNTNHSV